MSILTIINLTRTIVSLPNPIGNLAPLSTKTVQITSYDLEKCGFDLIALNSAGIISFSTAVEGSSDAELDTEFLTALGTEEAIAEAPSAPASVLVTTTGPTNLAIGAWADGQGLRRSGTTAIGYTITDKRTAKIIVGNSAAGDTAADCDYLDTGNGVQLQAAITAAGAGANRVYVREGTYAITSTITVPSFVHVEGANWGGVTISTPGTLRKVLTVGGTSTVENFFISMPVPAVGATGTEIIEVNSGATLRQIDIFLANPSAGQAANESLTAGIRCVAADAGVFIEEVYLSMYSKRNVSIAADLVGFEVQSRIAASHSYILGCRVTNADIGYDLQGAVSCAGWHFNGLGRAGIRLGASNGAGAQRVGPTVSNGFCRILNIASLAQFGVIFDTGSDASGMISGKCIGSHFYTTSASLSSAGASFIGTGVGCIVDDCSFDSFVLGIAVTSATQTNVLATNNTIRSATTNYTDASGSANFGGRSEAIGPFFVTTAATQTDTVTSFGAAGLGWVATRAGSITAFSVNMSAAFTVAGGSFTVQKALAASPTSFTNIAATTVSFTAGGTTVARIALVRDASTLTFAAGDVLRVVYTTAGIGNTPTASGVIEVTTN